MTIYEFAIYDLLIMSGFLAIARYIKYLLEKDIPKNYKSSDEIPFHILEQRIKVRASIDC